MFPAIRTGFTSTLDLLGAWWRGRVANAEEKPRVSLKLRHDFPPASDEPPIGELSSALTEDALRRFIVFGLDERSARMAIETDSVACEAMLHSGSAVLASLEIQAKYLPRRPSVLPRLLSTMNSNQGSMPELAAIIGDDPALMGNLVRLANSAFYRGVRKSVDSLERAVTMVGTDGVRGLIATALMHPVMSSRGGMFSGFADTIWEQTLYAADAAEMHAVHVEHGSGFGARLLALLHGLSTNTVFRIVRDECLTGAEPGSGHAVARLIEEWAGPMARRIAASWEMPHELQDALAGTAETAALARSLYFGRFAGAHVLMVRRLQLKESAGRAAVLALDPRRIQVERVWQRLMRAHARPNAEATVPRPAP
jgi:HD-like signal output (HDOD) protein